ncbi:hypothetical protein [Aureispira anguillae]|uniref:Uncharacterized protein n=1 Tax=Aureispira anguillae TaxID=2864201 RepID=A0A916DXK8_9BACT|nr:hypothetical protein [Aureispira anguillae]BDS15176.1 hypothetical protein AsAng_0059600 [Aureispira anguillae]
MAFKNPFTIPKLKAIKAPIYIKTLKAILTNKFKDGESVPFSIILNHIYNGYDKSKSEKLPFCLFGEPKDGEANWKKFRDSEIEGGKKQKEFMLVGTCHRKGNHLVLEINKSKGISKMPRKTLERLQALLRNINKELTISTKEPAPELSDNTPSGAAPAAASGEQPSPEKGEKTAKEDPKKAAQKAKVVAAYKAEKQDEAKQLSEEFKNLRSLSGEGLKQVVENIKKGATTKKDLKVVKEINKAYSSTLKLYKGTAKQVQKKFEAPYKDLLSRKKELYKLSLATKQKKKSLAQSLADKYYNKKKKRKATDEEINEVQAIIKDVIAMNKKRRKKAKQKLLFKATSYVLNKTGVKKFKTKYVNQILQKKVA